MLTYAFVQSAIDMYDVDYGYTVLLRHRRHVRARHRRARVRRRADGRLVVLPGAKPFFRGESLNRETPVLVPEDPEVYQRSVDGGLM